MFGEESSEEELAFDVDLAQLLLAGEDPLSAGEALQEVSAVEFGGLFEERRGGRGIFLGALMSLAGLLFEVRDVEAVGEGAVEGVATAGEADPVRGPRAFRRRCIAVWKAFLGWEGEASGQRSSPILVRVRGGWLMR